MNSLHDQGKNPMAVETTSKSKASPSKRSTALNQPWYQNNIFFKLTHCHRLRFNQQAQHIEVVQNQEVWRGGKDTWSWILFISYAHKLFY